MKTTIYTRSKTNPWDEIKESVEITQMQFLSASMAAWRHFMTDASANEHFPRRNTWPLLFISNTAPTSYQRSHTLPACMCSEQSQHNETEDGAPVVTHIRCLTLGGSTQNQKTAKHLTQPAVSKSTDVWIVITLIYSLIYYCLCPLYLDTLPDCGPSSWTILAIIATGKTSLCFHIQ